MASFSELVATFERIERAVATIPSRLAVVAVNFSKERFVKKDWFDTHSEPWQKTRKKKGSTLVASGRLKLSIRRVAVTATSVTIGSDVPYAQIHNEGGEIEGTETVKAHTRRAHKRKGYSRNGKRVKATKVNAYEVSSHSRKYKRRFEKRQFIGQSKELDRRIDKMINELLSSAIEG